MKKITALSLSIASFFTLATPAFAAVSPCAEGTQQAGLNFFLLCNLSLDNVHLIPRIFTLILIIATIIALAFLIFGGVKWILSGGEKTKVEEARGTIVAALVGLVITFLAYFIINIVLSLFGLGGISGLDVSNFNLFN